MTPDVGWGLSAWCLNVGFTVGGLVWFNPPTSKHASFRLWLVRRPGYLAVFRDHKRVKDQVLLIGSKTTTFIKSYHVANGFCKRLNALDHRGFHSKTDI